MEVVVFAAVAVSESLGKPLTSTSRSRTFESIIVYCNCRTSL